MDLIPRKEAFDTLNAYHKLPKSDSKCIDSIGKTNDGYNLYRIVEKISCPHFRTSKVLKADEHEEVLNKFIEDFKILYGTPYPSLISTFPPGFVDFLDHSGLRERAIEVFKSKGFDVLDLGRGTK